MTAEPAEHVFRLADEARQRDAPLSQRALERLQARLNPPVYRTVLRNGFVARCLLRRRRVPTPRLLGLLHPATGFLLGGGALRTPADLSRLLGSCGTDVVLAPAAATPACGGLVLQRGVGPRWRTADGRELEPSELFERLFTRSRDGEWLVEERVVPHPFFARHGPDASHVRLVTLLEGSDVHVLGATCALAASEDEGVESQRPSPRVALDPVTGAIGETVCGRSAPSTFRDGLPNARLAGQVVPFWSGALDLVSRAAHAVPWMRTVGWDLVLGEDRGWRVLDGDAEWDAISVAARGPGVKRALLDAASSGGRGSGLRQRGVVRRVRITAGMAARTWLPLAREVQTERGFRRGLNPIGLAKDLLVRRRTLQEALQLRLWEPPDAATFFTGYLDRRTVAALRNRMNPQSHRILSRHKYVTRCILEASGVRMAPLLGVFQADWGFRPDGRPLRSLADLEECLSVPGVEPVFKPASASQGQRVMVFGSAGPGVWPRIGGVPVTTAEIHGTLCAGGYRSLLGRAAPEWIVERRVRPHASFARFGAATSVVRIVTLLHGGTVQVVAGCCCLPAPGRSIANVHQDGVLAGLDVTTGVLGEGIRKGSASRCAEHPASGVRFAGERVPAFTDLLDLTRQAARALPWLRSIGWDCAADEEGRWHVLEANHGWGIPTTQLANGRGLREGLLGQLIAASG